MSRKDLDDDQLFKLMKFRRILQDVIKPKHDDEFLCRWLRARNWNLEAAEKMLRKSLEWRKKWGADDIHNWKAPDTITKYYPSGISGRDKDGAPVYIVPIGGLDVVGIISANEKKDCLKFMLQILEHVLELAAEKGGHEVTIIFDLEGFVLKNYAWRPATELVILLLQFYEANYPEILKVCFIINAPKIFAIAYNVIKKFLHEYTISKIRIYKTDPLKWKAAIREVVDGDNLPQHWGGDLVDPDGDPRYPSKVKPGCKVPKELYRKKNDAAVLEHYTTTVIKKGHKLTLEFIVTEPGSYLKWNFKTDEHDIKFGIESKDVDGNVIVPIPLHRVSTDPIEETGALECLKLATYTVTFDNSYSIMRSKKLHYNIEIAEPLAKIEHDIHEELDA